MMELKKAYWQKPLVKKFGNWFLLLMTFVVMSSVISFYVTKGDQLIQINNFTYSVTNSTKPVLREITTPLGESVFITSIPFSGQFNDTGTQLDFTHSIRTYQTKPAEGYIDTWLSWHSTEEELEVLLINSNISQSECRIDNKNAKWEIECLYIIESSNSLVTEYLLLGLSNEQKEKTMTDYLKANLIIGDYLNNKQALAED